ncbi:hypothetical protein HMPREF9374_2965 [Desmospora sp. 8437]|nr:hypothetical protein HMPREF9374_2965 [Desmospora sp. 8437]
MQGGLGFTWSDFGSSEQRKRSRPSPNAVNYNTSSSHPALRGQEFDGVHRPVTDGKNTL